MHLGSIVRFGKVSEFWTEQHVQKKKVLGEGGGIIAVSSFLGGYEHLFTSLLVSYFTSGLFLVLTLAFSLRS